MKLALRDKRFVLREFSYDGNKSGSIDSQIDSAKAQVDQTISAIARWCLIHYGEVYSGWIHLKVIGGFAESVLRYGLPVNFVSLFVEPNMQKEKSARLSLLQTVVQLRPELDTKKMDVDEEEHEGGDDSEHLPFVLQRFNVVGASGGESK